MPRYNLIIRTTIAAIVLLILSNTAPAQYWFQSGVRAADSAGFNNGAGVTIQTVYQNATNGSLGFWVGEDLPNGAFVQVGYEITNSTGYYSSSCTNSTKSVYLQAGLPTWFWEYFDAGSKNTSFCGGIGPNGSAGPNNGFNTYSFRSSGNIWNAYFDGQLIGSVNLGVGDSGPNPPVAFAEYADTNSNKYPLTNVTFKNMVFYIDNMSRLVPEGYATVSYGKGSITTLPNTYGVKEVSNYVNDFEVGSSIPTLQGPTTLWELGYSLAVYSIYGNLTSSGNYMAYSVVPLNAPDMINVSKGIREIFEGWNGHGTGSYSGSNPQVNIMLSSNITETAIWQTQYYLNATSQYGELSGAGWYNLGSIANVSVGPNIVPIGNGSRVVFAGWSNNVTSNRTSLLLNGPKLLEAVWNNQYYLNVTSPYGGASGSGWYGENSVANVSLATTVVPVNQSSRFAFKQWSNGDRSNSILIQVNSPTNLVAEFGRQYVVRFVAQNADRQNLTGVDYYNVSSQKTNSSMFIFANTLYNVEYFHYKGVNITTNYKFQVDSPTSVMFLTPVYNIVVKAQSVFDTPVNASLNITFKNNTNVKTYLGNDGSQSFVNVPYGYITGYEQYFGLRQSVNLYNGVDSDLTFFTASLVALIVGGIALIVAVARITAYYERKRLVRTKR